MIDDKLRWHCHGQIEKEMQDLVEDQVPQR